MSETNRNSSRRASQESRFQALDERLSALEAAIQPLSAGQSSPASATDVEALVKCNLELSEARLAADSAARLRVELFGLVNREIRTPLAGLLGVVGLLERTKLPGLSAEYVATIAACGREIHELLNEALGLSELSQRELEVALEERSQRDVAGPARPAAPAAGAASIGAAQTDAGPRANSGACATTRSTVLIVEDNLVNQRVAQKLLERSGVAVVIASDGREALAALETSRFDVVLMDCEMPVLDGFEATRELRARERRAGSSRTPVIALTASCLPEERLRCFECGMDDFLAKPASTEVLLAKLRQWLPQDVAAAA
ncbi:MAG: response regulator [Planctomycetota bacterium]